MSLINNIRRSKYEKQLFVNRILGDMEITIDKESYLKLGKDELNSLSRLESCFNEYTDIILNNNYYDHNYGKNFLNDFAWVNLERKEVINSNSNESIIVHNGRWEYQVSCIPEYSNTLINDFIDGLSDESYLDVSVFPISLLSLEKCSDNIKYDFSNLSSSLIKDYLHSCEYKRSNIKDYALIFLENRDAKIKNIDLSGSFSDKYMYIDFKTVSDKFFEAIVKQAFEFDTVEDLSKYKVAIFKNENIKVKKLYIKMVIEYSLKSKNDIFTKYISKQDLDFKMIKFVYKIKFDKKLTFKSKESMLELIYT